MEDVVKLFNECVTRQPNVIAIIDHKQRVSYRELNDKADKIARFLKATHNIQNNHVVAISARQKSIDLLVILLAILKAGAAYFLINEETIKHTPLNELCKAVNVQLLIAEDTCAEVRTLSFKELDQLNGLTNESFSAPIHLQNLAYVIATSGTTGAPKLIGISHQNLANTFASWQQIYELQSTDVHLQMANHTFDVFTGDWVRALCSGATLVLCQKEELLNPNLILNLITQHQVSVAEFVPAVLRKIIEFATPHQLASFRLLICGSDIWHIKDYQQLQHLCSPSSPSTRVINSYGLSESTIDATYYELTPNTPLPAESIVPIGKPFPHVTVKILNKNFEEVEKNVEGES